VLAAAPHRLVSAPWVVPIASPALREGALVLDADGVIAAIGPRAALRPAYAALPETRGEGVLLPGLVNAHTHLELSALVGRVPGGGGVIAWTRALAGQLHEAHGREAEESDAGTAAQAAALDARARGTAALGDVGNGTAGWRAMGAVGLQGLFFHELVGSREARTGDALADAERERATLPERPARVAAVPAPHAPYSVGPALLERIFAAAEAAGLPTSIHLAEDPDELALLRDGSGGWPAVLRALGASPEGRSPGLEPCAYLASRGGFATRRPPLLVHMVHASADDRRRAREAGATIVLCPRSNLHIGGRLPDVPALLEQGVALALGTDSLASVPDLSLWAELSVLANAFPAVAPGAWLEAATAGGARALGLSHLGTLAPGARPGLLDVLPAATSAEPERDLVSAPPLTLRWLVSP
jgi:cytosine/adenosine deaminase-related metal-dependent hydrolase